MTDHVSGWALDLDASAEAGAAELLRIAGQEDHRLPRSVRDGEVEGASGELVGAVWGVLVVGEDDLERFKGQFVAES